MKKTFLLSIYLSIRFTACISQELQFADANNTISRQIAIQKYAEFLEQTDFYAFHDHDLDPTLTETFHAKNQTRAIPLKPSFYSRFNQLQPEIQDHITGYLQATKRSKILDPATNSYPMIIDQQTRNELRKNFEKNLKKYEKEDLNFLKSTLRVEHWHRFIQRARGLHVMINDRMQPSELLTSLAFHRIKFGHPVNIACENKYPEHDIEIAALMIGCGALVQQDKLENCTSLYHAIEHDNIPMIKLLMKAGMSNLSGSKNAAFQNIMIILAAQNNALQTIEYLYRIGHNLNMQTKNGFTSLHQAYLYNNHIAVKLLLQLGANPEIKNKQGNTYNYISASDYLV